MPRHGNRSSDFSEVDATFCRAMRSFSQSNLTGYSVTRVDCQLSNITVAADRIEPMADTPCATAPFLTEVWKEACQHIELAEAAARISPHLDRRAAARAARSCARSTSRSMRSRRSRSRRARRDASRSRDELARRARRDPGLVSQRRRSSTPPPARCGAGCPDCFRPRTEGDVLVGSLGARERGAGRAVLVAPPGERFERDARGDRARAARAVRGRARERPPAARERAPCARPPRPTARRCSRGSGARSSATRSSAPRPGSRP